LLGWGRPTRTYLVTTVLLGTLRALLLIAQAWLLATIVAGAFVGGEDLAALRVPMERLLAVIVLRALLAWGAEVSANRCSARVKSLMRTALVEQIARLGPMRDVEAGDEAGVLTGRSNDRTLTGRSNDRTPAGRSAGGTGTGDLAALTTRGIDALDGYYARYLPTLMLAVIVPILVVAAVLAVDWISAAIMAVTLPLIPVFMALVGMATRASTNRQFRALQVLSGHFLDVVSGLTTLKIFGRSRAQVGVIHEVTDRYRRRLMATLRITFLSSLVLELLASVSVALIAVAIGLRLLNGHMDLHSALFVLVLAPEAYLPLRQVGADYHASAEGMSAADQVFEVLGRPSPTYGSATDVPDPAVTGLVIECLEFTYPGRDRPALDRITLTVEPGEVLAVTGPSGSGKSTLLAVLLGFVQPDAGVVRVGDVELAALDPDAWRRRIAWVPQRPHLFASSVADNIRLGRPEAGLGDVRHAAAMAGLGELLDRLPSGLDTVLGQDGAGLSAGERQRVALARAFLRDAPLLLLDEPTANLDGRTEADVLDAVSRLAAGRTVVLVAHRPALLSLADRVVDLTRTVNLTRTGVPV
jgi:thiol reductant ABC exporter CydD subunit